nr:hypothetical protein [Tanacetum cinerariifolium]
MLAICAADTPVVFKDPKPSSNVEKVPQDTKPRAKTRHKKHSTSLKQSSVSSKEAIKDDLIIVVDNTDEDEEDEIHAATNDETEYTSKQVHELEIELPRDLKEISTTLKDFTKTITSLTSQVAELKSLQWELPVEFLSLPVQFASVQAKLKTLDALPGLLFNVTQALNKFAQILNSASSKAGDHSEKKLKKFDFITEDGRHIHLTIEEINHQKKLAEDAKAKAAKQEGEYDKYYDKILNRRPVSRITNYDVFTRKGPITVKVYREDGTSKIIPNFKASDLHLGEWREVMKACPNRTRKGSGTIYKHIGDETLTIRSNRIDGYASIVSSEQRIELFDRISTLERDNMRLRG